MVKLNLWSGLRRFAADQTEITVEARTLRVLLAALIAAHPALAPAIKAGVSVSLNGDIVIDLSTKISDADEIFLIQRIKGG
ncbi:MAG: MoaD/ThiS family protein [Microgenomates group bacterium]